MWFRKNLWNRSLNTIGIAPRTLGSWLHTIEDATKTVLYTTLNAFEWVGKTASSIKEAVNNACTKWPRYHKLWKAPVSLAASPFMAIEWVGETLRYSWCNLLRYTRDTIANPFINFWHWVKRMFSSKDPWNFKFEKVTANDITPQNKLAKWVSSLFSSTPTVPTTPTPAPRPTTPTPAP